MKAGCATILVFIAGFAGLGILYMAINQYILKGESLHEHGIPVQAVVVDTLIVHDRVAGGTAPFSVPVIRYTVEDKTITDTTSQWSYRLDTENIISQSNSLWLPGDTLTLLVHHEQYTHFIREGESDPTNRVGFVIWGTIGTLLLIPFFFRLKNLFPKDQEQKRWES
jgi:archaellum component FlaF (FlaF/FlaG flagellin family)